MEARNEALKVLCLLGGMVVAVGLAPGVGAAEEKAPAASTAKADSSCAEAVASRVQAYYDRIRDLEAGFEQTTHSVTMGSAPLGSSESSEGRVVFAKPGKMRWSYERPEPSLLVSDGTTVWLYNPARKEASRLPVAEGYLTGAALQFLLGEGKLLEEFAAAARGCGSGKVELELVPLKPASYERLNLVAVEDTGEITSTSVVDLFGNETRISFHGLRVNLDPPPDTFVFEVPPGVEVIDVAAPQNQ